MPAPPATEEVRRKRRRRLLILFLVLAVLAALLIAVVARFFFGFHCTDGDGGVPFVARDSPQKGVCDATENGGFLLIAMLVLIAGAAVVARRYGLRWVAGPGGGAALIVALAAIPVLPFFALLVADAPSDSCGTTEQAAFDEWVDSGQRGPQPYDCATY